MNQQEVDRLLLDIERSVQLRDALRDRLTHREQVDLVEAWNEIEQIDLEIANKIRKRRIE